MRKLTLFLSIALVLTFASGLFAQATGLVKIDNVTNLALGDYTKLRAGNDHVVSIYYDFTGLTAKWSALAAFELYSPEGANWVDLVAANGPLTNALAPAAPDGALRIFKYYTSDNNGVSYTGTAQIPYPLDEFGEEITNPTNFVTPGPNPTAGTNPNISRVAYSHAIVGLGNIGYQAPLSGISFTLQFSTLVADEGKTMCLDSLAGRGTVAWNWAKPAEPDGHSPRYDNDPFTAGEQPGPKCWEIFVIPNLPPEWCNGLTGEVTFNHCVTGSFELCATDPDDPDTGPISYSLAPAFDDGLHGEIIGDTWSWGGSTVPHEGDLYIDFFANDSQDNSVDPFTLHVIITNNEPTIDCPDARVPVTVGKCKQQVVTLGDDVCDLTLLNFEILAGTGYDLSEVSFVKVGNEVTVTFCPTDPANAGDVDMLVQVTYDDTQEIARCTIPWKVTIGSDYQVLIPKLEMVFQGQYVVVPIELYAATYGLGGFDFLVAYDASALAFVKAEGGDIYDPMVDGGCAWEYFTYRYGANGNCNGACPSGLLRVIGMAETNNGPFHPDCFTPAVLPKSLADLTFLVSNDRTLECQYVPIRFFWYDCGDNTISNEDGSILYLEEAVFDFYDFIEDPFFETSKISSDDSDSPFPTYLGTQEYCVCTPYDEVLAPLGDPTCKQQAIRAIAFQNGGVDIACADLIDDRGDINMNGLGYEIADAVMFTNYFIQGVSAFADCTGLVDDELQACLRRQQGSIAASDTNADGLALTVADLVYLIRVVIGDAQPYDKVTPVAAKVTYGDGIFNVDAEMGAAHIVMAGEVTPRLLATNMEMKYGVVDGNTNILVYSMEPNQSFSGQFLQVEGRMISSQFATFLGQPVNADVMPANFALHQNYPNPFNPTTTIKIEIPKTGVNWNLNIYNVTGQLVQTMSGKSTGYDEVVWDASNNASGIYFYKLTAGDFSATKKAVLLK